MDIHAAWRNEDVIALVPELKDALADPNHIGPEAVSKQFTALLDKQVANIQVLLGSEDFQNLRTTQDPKAFSRVLEKLEASMLDVKRVVTFIQMSDLHYADQAENIQASLQTAAQQLQSVSGFLSQSFSEVISYVASLDDDKLQRMMAEQPELKKFSTLIERCKKAPQPDSEKIAQLDTNRFYAGLQRLQQSSSRELSDDEQKQAFAEGLSEAIRFKQSQSVAGGFKDTLEQFSFSNVAPKDVIDNLNAASQAHMSALLTEFQEIQKLAETRLPSRNTNHRYTWDETKDIVCAAYSKLDPALGKLAQRAFDEGWLLAKEYGVPNPHTLAGLPNSVVSGAHPFATMNFDGGVMDVMFVGHEMAHVLSNYIAGEKQGVFTHDAPLLVQESFSHFGEALLENEMLNRAENPTEKARVEFAFAAKEFDALGIIGFAKFEEELYALVKSKGNENPTFDEINALFKTYCGETCELTGEEPDVREMPALWNVLMQPPHTSAVYPITKIMAAALHEEFEKNPEQFRERYQTIMEAGGTIGVTQLWDNLLGTGIGEQKAFVSERLEKLTARITVLKEQLAELPIIEKEPVLEQNKENAPNPNADASDFPVIGAFTGAFAKRLASPPLPHINR